MNGPKQRIADFRAGAKWCAQQYEEIEQRRWSDATRMERLMSEVDRISGIRDAPLGPSDDEVCKALGISVEVRPEGVTAAGEVLAQQIADEAARREVRRRMCERVFLYRLAEWLRVRPPRGIPRDVEVAAAKLVLLGEPWQHPDYQITPPAKEEPK